MSTTDIDEAKLALAEFQKLKPELRSLADLHRSWSTLRSPPFAALWAYAWHAARAMNKVNKACFKNRFVSGHGFIQSVRLLRRGRTVRQSAIKRVAARHSGRWIY